VTDLDPIEQRILTIIDEKTPELYRFANDIYSRGEPGFREFCTAGKIARQFRALGLPVAEGLAVTGVKARLGSGRGPTAAVISELDGIRCAEHPFANPENGVSHACGHHAQMTAMLGAAMALTDPEVREALDGDAVFFAVPAEEHVDAPIRRELREAGKIRFNGGKSELIRIGAFDDVDVALTTHVHMVECGSDLLLGNLSYNGFVAKTVVLHGKAAHAANAPHLAVNALNAASLGLSAIGMLRETFREQDYVRVHPIITKGGSAVNVVPDEVRLEMQVRAKTLGAMRAASEKVDRAFTGAAYAIGATAEILDEQGYLPIIAREADEVLLKSAALLEDVSWEPVDIIRHNTASTDVGDLTHLLPVVNFTHGGFSGSLHSQDFTITDEYKALAVPAKLMALTVYQLLRDGGKEARRIKAEFQPVFTKESYTAYVEGLDKK